MTSQPNRDVTDVVPQRVMQLSSVMRDKSMPMNFPPSTAPLSAPSHPAILHFDISHIAERQDKKQE